MVIIPDSNSQPWTPSRLSEAFPPPKKKRKGAPPPPEEAPEAAAEDAPESARRAATPTPPPARRPGAPPPAAPAKRPPPPAPKRPQEPDAPSREPVDYEPAPGEGEDDTEVTDDEEYGEPLVEPPPARKREYLMKKGKKGKRVPPPVVAEASRGPEIHSAKAHRCVDEVTAKGGAAEPWAVCTASIGKRGVYTKGHGGAASPKKTRETDAAMDAVVEAMVRELRR